MTSAPLRLTGPARALSRAALDAVRAADAAGRGDDLERFERSAAHLAAQDDERVRLLLGAVVRALLEDLHPDGLSGDDVADELGACVRDATWCRGLDPSVLLVLLAGALGVSALGVVADDEATPVPPDVLARHAPVLIAFLLARRGQPFEPYLDAAFAEVHRAETVEMP